MIHLPSRDDLKALSEERGDYCISIYMPTARKGVDTLQGPIRLKNLLRQAESKLEAAGMKVPAMQEYLQEAWRLVDAYDFWQHQLDGLAVFIHPSGEVSTYRLPLHLEEDVLVNSHFHLKPLMQVLTGNGRFFLLALSQRSVRLFEATRFTIAELELPENMPRSLADAMKYDEIEPHHHFSPGSQGRHRGGIMEFAGHGTDASDTEGVKERMRRFFLDVDAGVMSVLHGENAPLLVAALEYMHPIYRDANTYPHLITEASITRAVDDLRPEELHEFAWMAVEPLFQKDTEVAIERFNTLKGRGLASSDLREVVPAAIDGRVEALIVPIGEHRWGTFEPESRQVELRDEPTAAGEDLLDLAAVRTFLNGGVVFAVEQEKLPERASVAAVFRY